MENLAQEKWQKLVKSQKSQSELDNKKTFPEKISSYIFIFDCFENIILYTNTAFETITGYQANQFDLDHLIGMIHPDDLPHFFSSEERGLNFTNNLLFNEHFKYILSYSYRIKTSDGEFIRVLQQCQALEVNESGHLTKTLVIHKRIDNLEKNASEDYKIFDKTQNMFIDDENSYNLSERELEILNLIKQGMNSQQVSETLRISKNTVLTHRKNILNKTNSNSFIELIKKISISEFA